MSVVKHLKLPIWDLGIPSSATLFVSTDVKVTVIVSEVSKILGKNCSNFWALFVYRQCKKKIEWECPLCPAHLTHYKTKSLLSLKLAILRHLTTHRIHDKFEAVLNCEWTFLEAEFGTSFGVFQTVPKCVRRAETHRSSINFITLLEDPRLVEIFDADTLCEICCEGVKSLDHLEKHAQLEIKPSFSEFFSCDDSDIDRYPFPQPLLAYGTHVEEQSTNGFKNEVVYMWHCRFPSCSSCQLCTSPSTVVLKAYALRHFQEYHEGVFRDEFYENEWRILHAEGGLLDIDFRRYKQEVDDETYPDDFLLPFTKLLIPFTCVGYRICGFCFFPCRDGEMMKRHLKEHGYKEEGEPFLPPKSLDEGVSAVRDVPLDLIKALQPLLNLYGDKKVFKAQKGLWERSKVGSDPEAVSVTSIPIEKCPIASAQIETETVPDVDRDTMNDMEKEKKKRKGEKKEREGKDAQIQREDVSQPKPHENLVVVKESEKNNEDNEVDEVIKKEEKRKKKEEKKRRKEKQKKEEQEKREKEEEEEMRMDEEREKEKREEEEREDEERKRNEEKLKRDEHEEEERKRKEEKLKRDEHEEEKRKRKEEEREKEEREQREIEEREQERKKEEMEKAEREEREKAEMQAEKRKRKKEEGEKEKRRKEEEERREEEREKKEGIQRETQEREEEDGNKEKKDKSKIKNEEIRMETEEGEREKEKETKEADTVGTNQLDIPGTQEEVNELMEESIGIASNHEEKRAKGKNKEKMVDERCDENSHKICMEETGQTKTKKKKTMKRKKSAEEDASAEQEITEEEQSGEKKRKGAKEDVEQNIAPDSHLHTIDYDPRDGEGEPEHPQEPMDVEDTVLAVTQSSVEEETITVGDQCTLAECEEGTVTGPVEEKKVKKRVSWAPLPSEAGVDDLETSSTLVPAETVTCQECNQSVSKSEKAIVEHVEEHSKKHYKCDLCSSEFSSVVLVLVHLREVHTVTNVPDKYIITVVSQHFANIRQQCFPLPVVSEDFEPSSSLPSQTTVSVPKSSKRIPNELALPDSDEEDHVISAVEPSSLPTQTTVSVPTSFKRIPNEFALPLSDEEDHVIPQSESAKSPAVDAVVSDVHISPPSVSASSLLQSPSTPSQTSKRLQRKSNESQGADCTPSAHSSDSEVIEGLMSYREDGVSVSPKLARKAIEYLVKKLESKEKVDALMNVLESKGKSRNQCFTVWQFRDGRIQIDDTKMSSLLLYLRIWRWPSVATKRELRKLECCTTTDDQFTCVNPYHYERISSVSPIVMELQCYQQEGVDREFSEKAVQYLVKKMEREEKVKALLDVLQSEGKSHSQCFPLRHYTNGRICIGGAEIFPHVVYTSIWRWPDITRKELRKLECCTTNDDQLTCVNPYHYERISPVSSIVMELQSYRQQEGVDLEFARRAIQYLVKRMEEEELEAFVDVLKSEGKPHSHCFTLRHYSNGTIHLGHAHISPHVVYTSIWRWPDITRKELRKLEWCTATKKHLTCVNPYHYERVSRSESNAGTHSPIVQELQSYQQMSDDLNWTVDVNPEYAKMAILQLVKLLETPKQLELLLSALKSDGKNAFHCVTIPRIKDGRMTLHGKRLIFPVYYEVLYTSIWRWPDITRKELRRLPCCTPAQRGPNMCVNPYHYERIDKKSADTSAEVSLRVRLPRKVNSENPKESEQSAVRKKGKLERSVWSEEDDSEDNEEKGESGEEMEADKHENTRDRVEVESDSNEIKDDVSIPSGSSSPRDMNVRLLTIDSDSDDVYTDGEREESGTDDRMVTNNVTPVVKSPRKREESGKVEEVEKKQRKMENESPEPSRKRPRNEISPSQKMKKQRNVRDNVEEESGEKERTPVKNTSAWGPVSVPCPSGSVEDVAAVVRQTGTLDSWLARSVSRKVSLALPPKLAKKDTSGRVVKSPSVKVDQKKKEDEKPIDISDRSSLADLNGTPCPLCSFRGAPMDTREHYKREHVEKRDSKEEGVKRKSTRKKERRDSQRQ